jgi:cell division septum initiation protein DivIVA
MQSQSAINDTSRDRLWDRDEIAQLIDYANYLKNENEDLRAGIIAMQAKLNNEESKVKHLKTRLLQLETYIIKTMADGTERN